MNEELLTKGNLTTFATWIGILLYPFVLKFGIEIDQASFVSIIYTLFVIIISVWSSKNPNTLEWLGNSDEPEATNEEVVGEDGV